MNMRRKWLENEKKWTPYKYLSDNTELTWKHDFKEDEPNLDYGNGEACLTTFFVPGSEDDWIALRCIRNGQIICQNQINTLIVYICISHLRKSDVYHAFSHFPDFPNR